MSAGAITLQCPQCGGVFLTLQHVGQTEICPHCAISGPRENFRAVMDAPRQRERTDLPSAKADSGMNNNSPSYFVTARPPVLDTPFPLAPENFAVVPKPTTPAAKDPEPPKAEPPAPSTPIADVSPLPAFTAPAYTNGKDHNPADSPSATKAPVQNRSEDVLPIPSFPPSLVGLEDTATPVAPDAAEPAPAAPPASVVPMWPGLDLDETPAPPVEELVLPKDLPPVIPQKPVVADASKKSSSAQTAAVRHRSSLWPKLAAAAAVALCAGWLIKNRVPAPDSQPPSAHETPKPMVAENTAPKPAPVVKPAPVPTVNESPTVPKPFPNPVTSKLPTVASSNPSPTPAPAPVQATPPPAPTPAPSPKPLPTPPPLPVVTKPVEITRPAVPAPVAAAAPILTDAQIDEAAAQAMKTLNTATEAKDRLAVIAEPDLNGADLEKYFAANKEPVEAGAPESSSGFVVLMPSKQEARLFRVITKRCPEGAMVFFHVKDKKALLDWPLFAQCQDHAYDQFATATEVNRTSAHWFTILCRRTHSFELKGANKDKWISLDAQGSLTSAGATVVYVNKDTPAGRYLDANLGWDRIYLTNLLLGKLLIEGHSRNVVLDCEATRSDKPVAGAKN